jgi:hypothetical protein
MRLGRRRYFILAAILLCITLLLPVQFIFVGGPAAWLLLFMPRARDIGRPVWSWVALAIVSAEIFGRPSFQYLTSRFGRETTGWVVIALFAIHLVFAVLIGLPPSRDRAQPRS